MGIKKYIALSPDYVIRELKSGNFVLIKWTNEEFFKLENLPKQILRLMNGSKSLSEILKILKRQNININVAKKFCENLIKRRILVISKTPIINRIFRPLPRGITANLNFVQWEISGQCNLKCKHCYNKNFINKLELSTQKCKSIIDEFDQLNTIRVSISGGEPLLRADLFEILKYLEKKRIYIAAIFSNGILLNKDIVREINHLKSNIHFILSLDGIDEDSYDFIRGRGMFKRLTRKLPLINNIEKRIGVNVMFHKKNLKQIPKLFDFILQNFSKVKMVRVGTFNRNEQGSYIDYKKEIGISLKEELAAYNLIISEYLKKNMKTKFQLELSNFFRSNITNKKIFQYSLSSHPCAYTGGLTFTIKSNGILQWCPTLYQLTFGDLNKTTLKKAFQSKRYKTFTDLRIEKLIQCKDCKFMKICGGGCRAMVFPEILKNDFIACQTMRFFNIKTSPLFPPPLQKIFKNLIS